MSSQRIYVSIELGEETHKVGKLWFRQHDVWQNAFSKYDQNWLKRSEESTLTPPALQLTEGSLHTAPNPVLFGTIDDSAL